MSHRPIRALPEHIANRIAAGEVVERPASVVKELLENAIDAGARNIDIEVEDGGISHIRIADDGDGIAYDELPLAVTHHATSKIAAVDDLERIMTLGFRGEALASISDVSRLEILSRAKAADGGGRIVVEGGVQKEHTIAAANAGTTINIRNLFYNLPARYKFLKQPSKELIAVKEVVEANILRYHGTGFRFVSNGEESYACPVAADREERLRAFLGSDVVARLIHFTADGEFFSIDGYVSDAHLTQGARRNAFVFVNGRAVESRNFAFNVKSAYDGVIPRDRFPYYYLFLTVDTAKVDVNVHPSKREVRIKNEKDISSMLYHSVREAVSGSARVFHVSQDPLSAAQRTSDLTFVDDTPSIIPAAPAEHRERESVPASPGADAEISVPSAFVHKPAEVSRAITADESKSIARNLRVIGQSFFSYIIAEHGNDLLVIDQHAAYERLNFERIRKNILGDTVTHEALLVPLEIEMSASDVDTLIAGKDHLARIGIAFDRLGPTTILVERIPVYLPKGDAVSILRDVFDAYLAHEDSFRFEHFLDEAVETIACKLSPKANANLSLADMQQLLDAVAAENILAHCPHGRPFILRLPKEYIDKKFFR
ncbi:MAG: DNA mismatch repair endonuclease MutL [Spirochaetota bacterium]